MISIVFSITILSSIVYVIYNVIHDILWKHVEYRSSLVDASMIGLLHDILMKFD